MTCDVGSTVRAIRRCEADGEHEIHDRLTVEEPLELRIADHPLAVTMRTPGHDIELAAGFCLTEGIVSHPDEIESIEPCAEADHDNVILIHLGEDTLARRSEHLARSRREIYLSSSCGLCGKQSIDRIYQQLPYQITGDFTIDHPTLATLPDLMRHAQTTFARTGGLHAAALFTPRRELIVLREDVGRHNAVDKVIGHQLMLDALPLDRTMLLVSGRASFEIMQKAAMACIPVVAAVSAPTSLAVDFAARTGQTLIGFLRNGRFNVYFDRPGKPRLL